MTRIQSYMKAFSVGPHIAARIDFLMHMSWIHQSERAVELNMGKLCYYTGGREVRYMGKGIWYVDRILPGVKTIMYDGLKKRPVVTTYEKIATRFNSRKAAAA